MDRKEYEKEQMGNRPTSAYEGRTQPETDALPGPPPFDSPQSHEREGADPAQPGAESETTRRERQREAGGDAGQRDGDHDRDR